MNSSSLSVGAHEGETFLTDGRPVLVNVSSLRLIISFFLASQATVWVAQRGLLAVFAIYAEAMLVLSLGIPGIFFFGKRLRQWTGGMVKGVRREKRRASDSPVSV